MCLFCVYQGVIKLLVCDMYVTRVTRTLRFVKKFHQIDPILMASVTICWHRRSRKSAHTHTHIYIYIYISLLVRALFRTRTNICLWIVPNFYDTILVTCIMFGHVRLPGNHSSIPVDYWDHGYIEDCSPWTGAYMHFLVVNVA